VVVKVATVANGLTRVNGVLSGGAIALSSLMVLLVMLMVMADIVWRSVFNNPVPGAFETVESMMVFIVFLAFAQVQATRGNIRVSVVTDRLPVAVHEALEAFACLVGLVLFALVVWKTGELALFSLRIRETMTGPSPYPLYPSKIAVPLGCAVLWLQFARDFLASIKRLITSGGERLD